MGEKDIKIVRKVVDRDGTVGEIKEYRDDDGYKVVIAPNGTRTKLVAVSGAFFPKRSITGRNELD